MKLPKPKTTGENSINAGDLVSYEHQGSMLIAVVMEQKANKFSLLNNLGKKQEVPAQRLHKLPEKKLSTSSSEKQLITALQELKDQCTDHITPKQTEELWEVVHEEGRKYSNTELTQLLLGTDSFKNHLGLRLALNDSIYFKRKQEFYLPRPAHTIEELKKAEKAREKKAQLQQQLVDWILECKNSKPSTTPKELQTVIKQLEFYAAGGALDNSRKKEMLALLELVEKKLKQEISGQKERKAFNLLRKLGRLDPFSNLALIRNRVPIEFPTAVVESAASLDFDSSYYVDRTNLECFTIDDVTTKDMDDALSLIKTESGYELGIYISDVAAMIPIDSSVDRVAKERATSLYFFNQTIHMLPAKLSEESCSLVPNEVRPTLSCICEFNEEFELQNAKVELSLIKVQHRYNYEQIDEMIINGNSPFDTLYNLGLTRELQRFENGGFRINKPDIRFERNGEQITIHDFDEQSPARNLVGEFMILGNEIMAKFASEQSLPYAFRSQQAPDTARPDIPEGLSGPAAMYLQRQGLKPSTTQLYPQPHYMLGLSHYAQATSPIRRYLDLCNQRQLRSFLISNKACYTDEELLDIIEFNNAPQKRAIACIREAKRQWILLYLWQRKKHSSTIGATVIRTDMKLPLLELDEIYLNVVTKLKSPVNIGDQITLKIKRVDPVTDDLILEQA